MEFTLVNIILLVCFFAISFSFGFSIGKHHGKINGLIDGKEIERKYLFSKIPKEVKEQIESEEYEKLLKMIFEDDE